MSEFTKLSNLIDENIKIERVLGYMWKKWDAQNNKMLTSLKFEPGYRKLWQVVTDKGQLDLGSGQIGNLLEAVMHSGKSDIIGVTYNVKSNGKTGIDIRYFLNPVRIDEAQEHLEAINQEEW
jgi:hypothetical protein